jgi:hypothetical protein
MLDFHQVGDPTDPNYQNYQNYPEQVATGVAAQ